MEKEILDILEKFTDKNTDTENVYLREIYDESLDFEEEIVKVFQKLGITKYDFCNIGGFESPGYEINCMCISYIDTKGELQTIPVNYELR